MELVFGMKDVYPWETRIRRNIEMRLRRLFESWGYAEVEPPTLEYYTLFEKTMNEDMKERIYKFLNRDGKLVCLRPEFTTSVARMYARENGSIPIRVYYSGKVFRYPSSPFRTESEFTQVGLECIGRGGPTKDAEVIALAILALQETGIQKFEVDLSHAGIFRGILESLPIPTTQRETVKKAMKRRDFVVLHDLCKKGTLPLSLETFLLRLPFLRGKRDLLEDLMLLFPESEQWQKAVQELLDAWAILEDFELSGHLWVNVGLVRDFDYYTGIIFEGFSPQVGYPLLAGGRYDELFRVFGKDFPACGFAIFLERILEALEKESSWRNEWHSPPVFLYPSSLRKEVLRLANRLRRKGIPLVLEESEKEECVLVTTRGSFTLARLDDETLEHLLKGERP
ncbi:ATP phosphoribosyltransferase regulatory subunit [Candidatus Caldatribacterium sp.]|uniref:ATP phosphoribosyltransferase regulatory subunit n=1 Tax=Candidatus Caldatribacterium sp. TaxID=2282143 RepID=UPI00299BDFDB|nr:ATP phosphoribosyltransferase regulatory subunit [Candidatus Caldatribacterium sp.]MDW8080550.1 ATP phosphoribosyltransferase regulatory subunit [Candidatus Calescibacterium sp.]